MIEKEGKNVYSCQESLSKTSRPGSAALGNTDAMRASLRNSRRSFSVHVRLVLRWVHGFIDAAIIAGSPYREPRFVCKLPEAGKQSCARCGCSQRYLVYTSPFQEACFVVAVT
ncbi:Brp1p SKDI_07G2480 [Saccharomyces kudriavzevii IFO 1802]|uniref:BRP1-like protein n=2 Tax=Saccharomyces kudriavzevii (strain ATCC MYA-4449 / AS 2.2408 / CBS 8840 / NBRC 1802 / NCYC 2889) TaxID=226230 RepID=J6EBD6_SACK1|nr:uncharacterized protein SKDI_07G2480 [Saccharomyces kudriavzevii IFO 1802]EJT41724.1 BRP1-like protein [Saccharomyces kudriavzevii IFO 1802]CAI4062021.1 hypothetical protein SKDI_07G2480 [Saccharomyces kudriavzevii IFO 1802]